MLYACTVPKFRRPYENGGIALNTMIDINDQYNFPHEPDKCQIKFSFDQPLVNLIGHSDSVYDISNYLCVCLYSPVPENYGSKKNLSIYRT